MKPDRRRVPLDGADEAVEKNRPVALPVKLVVQLDAVRSSELQVW